MSFTTAAAKDAYLFFQNIREEIRAEGMNGQRYAAITAQVGKIVKALKTCPEQDKGELIEVKYALKSLTNRQRIM